MSGSLTVTPVSPVSPVSAAAGVHAGVEAAALFGQQLVAARHGHGRQSHADAQTDDAPLPDASPVSASATAPAADTASEGPDMAAALVAGLSSAPTDKGEVDDGDASATAAQGSAAGTLAASLWAMLGHTPPAALGAASGGVAKLLAAGAHARPTSASTEAAPDGDPADADAAARPAAALAGDPSEVFTGRSGVLASLAADSRTPDSQGPAATRTQVEVPAWMTSLAPHPAAAAAPVAVHRLDVASTPGTPVFAQELGQQVVWLGQQDIKQARIRLHPEDLGQVDVKVSVQHGGQVDVSFAAQHPGVVHALQQTLPQLDALLAQQGLSLGQAQVGQQQGGGGGADGGAATAGTGSEAAREDVPPMTGVVRGNGLLDTFA
ncbi:flagellar hook-length control protein FliK [Aerosticca soli]|uniref:Flagellar hook-length control protein FliK n=1 Tax=Aerosticca soli TaxID=2010829 RepID=A0A2Z6E3P2_9GAMM|nr:flagellar hook-length control protein FliK [Aerosticca soli]BBD79381.1 flagellar hook-length control protein FliK [Aerosticca soli]